MVQTAPTAGRIARRKLLIQLVTFSAIAVLYFLKPRIEAWVESHRKDSDATVAEDSPQKKSEAKASEKSANDEWQSPIKPAAQPTSDDSKKTSEKKSDVVKMNRPQTRTRQVSSDPEKSNPPPEKKTSSNDSELGKLQEIENNVFESTAGLVYVPGSADGHRLKHVMHHAKDDLQKEIHGVFDGERDEILAVIDEAWMKTKKGGGSDVRSEKQNDRRIYTVNLKRRIGQMGGRQGERQGNPECRYLRIVLENETEVVSAYPTKSF